MANFDVELNDEVENFTVEFGEIQRITVDDFDKLRNRPSYAGQTMTHETNIPEVPTAVSQLTNDADYQTGSEVESAISTAVGDEKDAREQADAGLSEDIGLVDGKVDAESDARERADTALQGAIDDEETARKNADNGLQGQIDAITSSSDVVDIVGTYAELLQYPTAGLGDKDVIKVLQDETHNDAMSYYRWNKSSSTWSYIGSEGPYYTKSETNTLLGDKQDTLTAGSNVTIQGNTISATDTTYTAGNGLTLTGTEFSADTTVLQPKLKAGDGINISAQNVISADIDPADFFTASETVDGTGSEITLNNTIQAKIKSVQMDGDTFQKSYSGKNLLKLSGKTSAGVTGTVNADGSYTISGTGTVTDGVSVFLFDGVLPAGTYTLSLSKALPSIINIAFEGSVALRIQAGSTSATVTTTNEYTSASVFFAITTGVSYDETFNMQVTAGNTPDYDFEPYVGGIPAPSPDYPQTIQTVTGEQTVTVTGKNLFDKNNVNQYMGYFDGYVDNSSLVYGTTNRNRVIYIKCKPSTAYSISLTNRDSINSPQVGTTDSLPANGVAVTKLGNFESGSLKLENLTTPATARYIVIRFQTNPSTVRFDNISQALLAGLQIEQSSTASTYEPYQSGSYELNLGKNLWGGFSADMTRSIYDINFNNLANGDVFVAAGTSSGQVNSLGSSMVAGTDRLLTLEAGTYTISGATGVIKVQLVNNSGTALATDTGSGATVTLTNATQAFVRVSFEGGQTVADTTVHPQLEKSSTATPYAPYFTPIELCKIGDYQDNIYKSGDSWYVHKATTRIDVSSLGGWFASGSYAYKTRNGMSDILPASSDSATAVGLCNAFSASTTDLVYTSSVDYGFALPSAGGVGILIRNKNVASLADFTTYLSNNPVYGYFALATPTDTKITNATLISELDALADALGYKDKTIITVSATGTNLPAILEVSAYRNSLAGVLGVIGRAEAA